MLLQEGGQRGLLRGPLPGDVGDEAVRGRRAGRPLRRPLRVHDEGAVLQRDDQPTGSCGTVDSSACTKPKLYTQSVL